MRRLIPNGTDAEKEVLDNADLENLNAMLVELLWASCRSNA